MSSYINREVAMSFESIVSKSTNIVIISHTNPDGDAVGSTTAMFNYLKNRGMNVKIVLPDKYPDYLSFLDKDGSVLFFSRDQGISLELIDKADLIIALDFNQLKRVSEMECHILDSSARKIMVDHHPLPDNDSFDLVISRTEVSSTCELLYWLFLGMSTDIPLDVAQSLYVGIMTDTNNFSNSVSWQTFHVASHLLKIGVDKEMLQHSVFGGFSEGRMRLMGHLLLNKMVVVEQYGAAYIALSREEQELFDFSEGDSEGFVNLPLNIKGVFVSALFTQKKDGNIRVSLRSVNDFSVNKLSRLHFNGGGHERAAGGRLEIPFESVGSYFRQALEKSYDQCNGI